MDPIRLGAVLDGSYEINGRLGEGAIRAVCSARHRGLGMRVARKRLRPGIAWNQALPGGFAPAARAANAIGHLGGRSPADLLFPRPVQPPLAGGIETLGTPLYMSPEQLRAMPVGRSLFRGENYAVVR